DVTLALHSLTWNIDVAASMLLAGYVLVVTVGLRRATITPGWHAALGVVATVLLFLRGTNWASDGFWAPNGGYLYIGIGSALVWLAVTSGLLFRRASASLVAAGTGGSRPNPWRTPDAGGESRRLFHGFWAQDGA